jgi:N-acetylneuraminic acid mutarotase
VNGILYAVGGVGCCNIGENSTILSTVEAYNPTTNAWTTKAPMPTPRALGSVGVVDGILYAVGGAIPHIANTVAAYNPTRNAWTVRPPIPIARWHHAVGVVNGTMYVVGGISLSKSRTHPETGHRSLRGISWRSNRSDTANEYEMGNLWHSS